MAFLLYQIKRIVLEYAEKQTRNYQSVDHRISVEVEFQEGDYPQSVAEAIHRVGVERETLVADVSAQTEFDIKRITDV